VVALTEPPAGMIAMLFTDIEGSTSLAARLGPAWRGVLADHHALVGGAISHASGWIDGTEGDAFFATFSDPVAAAQAGVAALRALRAHPWPQAVGELKVRMGLHAGYVERSETGYVGLEVHRAARVGAAAHGGQLLLTAAARELIGDAISLEFAGAHRLKDFPAAVQLYCAIVDGRGASAFPPPRTYDVRPTNLPAGLPVLVGRDDDLELVRRALLEEGERIVSLTGRGGSGKTSLGLVAGSSLLEEHPGGAWWVNLAPITEVDAVAEAIAGAVGADRELGLPPVEAIAGHLRDAGPALLIVDNIEHVLGAADLLERLLAALPDLRMLVTTQVPLRLAAERVIALDALDDAAALALVERVARRRGVRMPDGEAEQAALRDLVRLLDGLPLALELAAARLALLSPSQLRDRLRASVDLLRDPTRPERQRSLAATVDWTLGLVDQPALELFTRLGAFVGPVELEEIEIVAGADGLDVLETLSTLRDVALVRRVESGDGRIRFGLPEALRQTAAARLDAAPDSERWRRAHAERQIELLSIGYLPQTQAQLTAAVAAQEEAGAALTWARGHDAALAQRIAIRRVPLLADRGRLREAAALLDPVLEAPPDDPDLHAEALQGQALILQLTNRHEEALRCADQAVALARDELTLCDALAARAFVLEFSGHSAEALRVRRRITALVRERGGAMLANALAMEVQTLIATGALDEAAEHLLQLRRLGDASDATFARWDDTQRADLAMARGRPGDALEPYARSLEQAEATGAGLQVVFDLRGMANALGALERDEDAAEVLGLAEAQAAQIGGGATDIAVHIQGDDPTNAALQRLGPELTDAARGRGRAVSPGMRVAHACRLARA
jgi:predicted ATPase/class 3 adenylate cyclase